MVTISVNAPDTALLVLSDTFYPGWKALVDNRETTIYRANYTFRAIVVPAGQHTVSFIYRPVSFRIGAWISLSTLALVALGSGASLWQWVRKRAET